LFDVYSEDKMKNKWQIKTGVTLIIISSVVYLLLLVVPFLKFQASVKLALVPVIIIIGEITFWAGTFFVGKELVKRYKSYLNPLKWFRKKQGAAAKTSINMIIRPMQLTDSEQVLEIFRMGIDTKNATFETEVPSWQDWNENHFLHSRFVAETDGLVSGWVALSPVSKRFAYRGVAEVSVYIHNDYQGKGLGSVLMEKVIESSEENGIWSVYSAVFPENKSSIALHKKYGFRVIGIREKIGQIDGIWRDTVSLERRSTKTGTEGKL
jgi:L-amino acid N-acyltransferase YncA